MSAVYTPLIWLALRMALFAYVYRVREEISCQFHVFCNIRPRLGSHIFNNWVFSSFIKIWKTIFCKCVTHKSKSSMFPVRISYSNDRNVHLLHEWKPECYQKQSQLDRSRLVNPCDTRSTSETLCCDNHSQRRALFEVPDRWSPC